MCQIHSLRLLQKLPGGVTDHRQGVFHGTLPGDTAGFCLHVAQRGLSPHQRIVDTLPGNTNLLGNLCQRKVLVVLEIKAGALLLGQKVAIVIE